MRLKLLAALAALVALTLAPVALAHRPAGPALTLDIADLTAGVDPLIRVSGAPGPTTLGQLGTPVAGGFDVDGDGHQDYAVGHMTTTNGPDRIFAGEAQLVFGDGTSSGAVDLAVPSPRVLRVLGDGFFEATGSELWMGDITGDGLGDLLVHRQNFDPGGRVGAGALTVVVGGPELRTLAADTGVLDLRSPPASVHVLTFVGAAENDRLGIWSRTGDVDGDGVDELVMAADQVSIPGETFRGAVYVVRGGAHLARSGQVDLADFGTPAMTDDMLRIDPPAGSDDFHFGSTLQTGDLNRNGRSEVFIAAALNRAGAVLSPDGNFTGDAVGGPPGGRLWIVWDDAFPYGSWPPGQVIDLTDPPWSTTTLSGGVQNVSFGEEVLGGLDYDGDRRPDLFVGDLVGDGTDAQDRPGSGVGYVFYRAHRLRGKTLNVDHLPRRFRVSKILGPVAGAIGSDTVTHGDLNGDGIDDLVIGNPHDNPQDRFHAGTMHILFGRHGRWPRTIDTAPGELPRSRRVKITLVEGARGGLPNPDGIFPPPDDGDTLCYSAAAGDVNGDGQADIITNEMIGNGVDPTAIDVGNLVIFDGEFVSPRRRRGHGDDDGDDDD
ncbi:MAG: hypothetical protein AAF481_09805 [Acidobacteriota bacterium]